MEGLNGEAYPSETWTPQDWFDALLKLNLASQTDRNDIQRVYKIGRGWQYNLIPFFIVQLTQTVLAFVEALRKMKVDRQHYGYDGVKTELGYAGR